MQRRRKRSSEPKIIMYACVCMQYVHKIDSRLRTQYDKVTNSGRACVATRMCGNLMFKRRRWLCVRRGVASVLLLWHIWWFWSQMAFRITRESTLLAQHAVHTHTYTYGVANAPKQKGQIYYIFRNWICLLHYFWTIENICWNFCHYMFL